MNSMKLILANSLMIIICCWSCTTLRQPNDGFYVKTARFTGYVFSEKHEVSGYIYEQARSRFTPTQREVLRAEEIISRELKLMNDSAELKATSIGTIYNNLNNYVRQYVGFVNDKGAKVIWVNFVRDGVRYKEKLGKQVIEVEDGGSNYWNVKVDLSERTMFWLMINSRG